MRRNSREKYFRTLFFPRANLPSSHGTRKTKRRQFINLFNSVSLLSTFLSTSSRINVFLSVYVCLSVPVCVIDCFSVCPSVFLSVCQSVYLSVFYPSIRREHQTSILVYKWRFFFCVEHVRKWIFVSFLPSPFSESSLNVFLSKAPIVSIEN